MSSAERGGGALEHHVFKEMADPHHCRVFVSGAGLHEEAERRRVRRGVRLGDDGQTVLERGVLECDWHGPSLADPLDSGRAH